MLKDKKKFLPFLPFLSSARRPFLALAHFFPRLAASPASFLPPAPQLLRPAWPSKRASPASDSNRCRASVPPSRCHPGPASQSRPLPPARPATAPVSRNRTAPTFHVVGASSPRPCLYKRKPRPTPHPLLFFPAPSRVAVPERTAAPRSPSSVNRPSARTASSEPSPPRFSPR
jgi:hypothetical protein